MVKPWAQSLGQRLAYRFHGFTFLAPGFRFCICKMGCWGPQEQTPARSTSSVGVAVAISVFNVLYGSGPRGLPTFQRQRDDVRKKLHEMNWAG